MSSTFLIAAIFLLAVVNCHPAKPCNDCCIYDEYSKWTLSSFLEVPTNQCASGYVVVEKRFRTVLSGNCENRTEERTAECAPAQSLRLAMLLDLGGSGQNTNSLKLSHINHQTEDVGSGRYGRATNVPWDDEDYHKRHVQICRRRGRRDGDWKLKEMREEVKHEELHRTSRPVAKLLESNPIEFDIHAHGHRYRRCAQCEVQHVLFLLDTSGSIGSNDFRQLTLTLGNLVPLFCKSIEIAAMTFSHQHYQEFCFNEFDNNCAGRYAARNAIKSIRYRGGGTHTAEAVQCAFENFFTPYCGLPDDAECVSVVFFTDGRSNGNGNVCEVVELLKQHRKFASYSIGVGSSINKEELRCLASDTDKINMFEFPTFEEFIKELGMVEYVFAKTGFTCLHGPDTKPSDALGLVSEDCSKAEEYGESGDGVSGSGYSGAVPK